MPLYYTLVSYDMPGAQIGLAWAVTSNLFY